MSTPQDVKRPKKLIEVTLPLEAINVESLRRKQKAPKGWPTSFHKWWAQRPIAAARAVVFGQLVNDPSWKWELEHPGEIAPSSTRASWAANRKRLFGIIEELVLWDNSSNRSVLDKVRAEILKSWRETCELNADHPMAPFLFQPDGLPAIYDPFAGSGTIPLEAQRMGLEVVATDLNPVAVLINKALVEIPSRFLGQAAVNPDSQQRAMLVERQSTNAQGLSDDVAYYGRWLRAEAEQRLGALYPPVPITPELVADRPDLAPAIGEAARVVAYLWARTVKSPNPAFRHVAVPLVSTYLLSSKSASSTYVKPIIDGDQFRFTVRVGQPEPNSSKGTKLGRGAQFSCILSSTPIDSDYIKAEGQAGRMGVRLMALVVETSLGRTYVAPTAQQEAVALSARPDWRPDVPISGSTQYIGVRPYGINTLADLFTNRQLVALSTCAELISHAATLCYNDAIKAAMPSDERGLDAGGRGALAYSQAIATYLAVVVDRMVFYGSSLCGWLTKDNAMGKSMPQQAMAMSWDFAEGNPLGKSSADILTCTKAVADCLAALNPRAEGHVQQRDAREGPPVERVVVSTDPPYFDNVPYADLSDFFYVWLRRSLKAVYPELFATISAPKTSELVAFAYRHEAGKPGATAFFLEGMTETMRRLAASAHPAFPLTIYYAFKQSDTDDESGTVSTGWETFLESVIRAGLVITGTWPMRTEGESRMRAADSNALASSIVLVCRQRAASALAVSRRAFLRELNEVLPRALDEMTKGVGENQAPVAPVDLSQAIIGPGMAVFSKYAAVLEADGTPMSVRSALQLINRFLAEDDFDRDTQFCLHWFEQYGWKEGRFGDADTLARAKGTAVDGVRQAGVLLAAAGVVRLLKWSEYPDDWKAEADSRLPVWEALHHLIRIFKSEGEVGAGRVLTVIQARGEATRQLAYRLYTLCERAGWAEDARAYNEIVTSWNAIETAAVAMPAPKQSTLFN